MLFENLGIDISYVVIGLAALVLLLFLLVVVNMVKYSKLKKRYVQFLTSREGQSLEEILKNVVKDVDAVKVSNQKVEKAMQRVEKDVYDCYSKIGIVRYDAFKGLAGKLSFSMAMLDAKKNGYILNCMHGNEGCYVYLKEVLHGEALVALSSEERKALEEALNCEKP